MGTPRAVYLIESKWTGETIINGQVVLAARQILRHQIFRWIRDRWLEQPDWEHFYHHNAADFTATFAGKRLAPLGSRLASNLEFLLQQLAAFPERTSDVLLYFHRANGPIPNGVLIPEGGPEFVVVPFIYGPCNDGGIIDMQA